MKTTMKIMGCMALSIFLMNVSYAQTPSQKTDQYSPKPLTDKTMGTRMQKDFTTRNPNMTDQPVSWYQSGEGFYGTYDRDNTSYMTRYDRNGKYMETMKKGEWNDNVSPSLKNSFDKSTYKDQDVTGYWESTDPNKKGYYMEMTDDDGKMSRVWSDDKGNFSTNPNSKPMTQPKK